VKSKPSPPADLQKPRSPGRIRAIFLAVAVHAAFFALIVFGVTWQSTPAPPVEAEIWDKLPPVKTAVAPKPEPEPVKPPEPKPEPPPPKPPEPAKEVKPEPVKPDPAIALKAEREKEKREKEKREKEKRDRLDKEKKKEEAAKLKREQEEAAQKKREDDQRRKEEELAKAEAEKARAAAAEAQRKEFDRYVDAIRARIRGRANVPDTVTGNPEVHVRIRILPGGEVLDIAITKRSGNPTYDGAIERAIRSASPLPVPAANTELFHQFRELNLNIRHER
jgi:colicin import membrane protein